MKILPDANGTYHLWDIVGTGDYPYPSDFIEEAIRMGISRRIPQSLMQSEDFKKLRGDSNPVYSSRHIMVHRRAIIVEMDELYKQRTYRCAERGNGPACPQGIPEHVPMKCAPLYGGKRLDILMNFQQQMIRANVLSPYPGIGKQ